MNLYDYFRKMVTVKTKSGEFYTGFVYDIVPKEEDEDCPDDYLRIVGKVRSDVVHIYQCDIDTIEIID